MPVGAEAGGTCTKHLCKAESVGFGYDRSRSWGNIILKSNFKVKFVSYENWRTVENIQYRNLFYCKFLNLCECWKITELPVEFLPAL